MYVRCKCHRLPGPGLCNFHWHCMALQCELCKVLLLGVQNQGCRGYMIQCGGMLPGTPWIHCEFDFELIFGHWTSRSLLLLPNFFTPHPDIQLQGPIWNYDPCLKNLCPNSLSLGCLFSLCSISCCPGSDFKQGMSLIHRDPAGQQKPGWAAALCCSSLSGALWPRVSGRWQSRLIRFEQNKHLPWACPSAKSPVTLRIVLLLGIWQVILSSKADSLTVLFLN